MSFEESARTRRELLIDGRRVRIYDLIKAGLLNVGQELTYQQHIGSAPHRAIVTPRGRLALPDGRDFSTPSGAAKAAARVSAVQGWIAWRVGLDGPTLDQLRQKLLEVVAAEVIDKDAAITDADAVRGRLTRLNDARARAEANDPITLTVRELLKLWNFEDREGDATAAIQADLDNHGLTTVPDFRAVSLDRVVRVVTPSEPLEEPSSAASTAEGADEETDDADETAADIGLTLGNLLSEDHKLRSVRPDAGFQVVITAMQLDDYSQIAVLEDDRTLVGAVTWKSIAEARHYNPEASFQTAIDRSAKVFEYNARLLDVIGTLKVDGFIFVRDFEGVISGIVTNADVVNKYDDTATPFFLIGEVDQELRQIVRNMFDEGVLPNGSITSPSADNMTMFQYQRVLSDTECWAHLDWPVDQDLFLSRLDEIRKVRNSVAHYQRDPVKGSDVEKLRHFLKLIRKCIK